MTVDFMAQRPTRDGRDVEWWGTSINVSNSNAAQLLGLLGYNASAEPEGFVLGGVPVYGELCGDDAPDKFLGRVLTALALLDAATDDAHGKPAVTSGGPGTGRATFIDCGRPPRYLARRLRELEDLANEAKANRAQVVWC